MNKIVAINIAFRTDDFYKRWWLMAEKYNLDITLIGPKYYVYKLAGKPLVYNPKEVLEPHFKVKHIDMSPKKYLRNDWWSWEYLNILREEKPDLVYLIGLETRNVVFKTYLYKKIFNTNLKIGLFSMRGKDLPLHGKEFKARWKIASSVFDFINVHYPHGKKIFKEQGKFKGPIQLQTQIGVDKDVFYKNDNIKLSIRQMYNIGENEFVFGSASRIDEIKGVYDILNACSKIDKPFKFIMMGNGIQFKETKELIKSLKLENKVILPGRIESGEKVAEHMNALDCFVHVPHTTKKWVDTFPLAVVQAMATELPVIGSDSGAVPYQLGKHGVITPEKNSDKLAEAMIYAINNPLEMKSKGEKLFERVVNSFEIRHLNKCLYQSFKAINDNDECKIIKNQVWAYNDQ